MRDLLGIIGFVLILSVVVIVFQFYSDPTGTAKKLSNNIAIIVNAYQDGVAQVKNHNPAAPDNEPVK